MARRIVSARDQVEMLSPWRTAAENPAPPSIHDIMPGRFSDGNGRWDYRHQETSGNSYLRHEYGIHPVTSPASHSYVDHRGKTHTVHYDPALTGGQLPRPGKWGHEWENPDAVRNKLTDLNPPPGMLWRGMSREEYERSRDRGYFESEGGHNFDSQQGLTFFSTKPEQAENYATWFAPQAYKPTFTHPGYVVGIPDRPDAPRGAIPGENEIDSTEVGLPGRIPFSEATHHYVGQVSTLTPGSQGVSEGWHGWEESGGSHPSSNIVWSQVHPGQHTAARRLAERADDLRWERSFDGGGGWILVTRTPDGNPVTIATSPTRGQRTSAKRPLLAININDTSQDYTGQIVRGEKTIETRDTNSLRPLIGSRVGISRTHNSPKIRAMVVGYATLGEPKLYTNQDDFDADYHLHQVGHDSPHHFKHAKYGVKYGYPLHDVEGEPNPYPPGQGNQKWRPITASGPRTANT